MLLRRSPRRQNIFCHQLTTIINSKYLIRKRRRSKNEEFNSLLWHISFIYRDCTGKNPTRSIHNDGRDHTDKRRAAGKHGSPGGEFLDLVRAVLILRGDKRSGKSIDSAIFRIAIPAARRSTSPLKMNFDKPTAAAMRRLRNRNNYAGEYAIEQL